MANSSPPIAKHSLCRGEQLRIRSVHRHPQRSLIARSEAGRDIMERKVNCLVRIHTRKWDITREARSSEAAFCLHREQ